MAAKAAPGGRYGAALDGPAPPRPPTAPAPHPPGGREGPRAPTDAGGCAAGRRCSALEADERDLPLVAGERAVRSGRGGRGGDDGGSSGRKHVLSPHVPKDQDSLLTKSEVSVETFEGFINLGTPGGEGRRRQAPLWDKRGC